MIPSNRENMIELIKYLIIIDSGQYVGAIFLNLAKAFNCDHDIVQEKLDEYGIREVDEVLRVAELSRCVYKTPFYLKD